MMAAVLTLVMSQTPPAEATLRAFVSPDNRSWTLLHSEEKAPASGFLRFEVETPASVYLMLGVCSPTGFRELRLGQSVTQPFPRGMAIIPRQPMAFDFKPPLAREEFVLLVSSRPLGDVLCGVSETKCRRSFDDRAKNSAHYAAPKEEYDRWRSELLTSQARTTLDEGFHAFERLLRRQRPGFCEGSREVKGPRRDRRAVPRAPVSPPASEAVSARHEPGRPRPLPPLPPHDAKVDSPQPRVVGDAVDPPPSGAAGDSGGSAGTGDDVALLRFVFDQRP